MQGVAYLYHSAKGRALAPPLCRKVSHRQAYACYMPRRDLFDGMCFTLQRSDPYTGGDFDHNTDLARVPATYAESSPSASGVRFIGQGTIPSSDAR